MSGIYTFRARGLWRLLRKTKEEEEEEENAQKTKPAIDVHEVNARFSCRSQ